MTTIFLAKTDAYKMKRHLLAEKASNGKENSSQRNLFVQSQGNLRENTILTKIEMEYSIILVTWLILHG